MGKDTQQKTQRQFSAGGVVFKKIGDKVLWLVTRSTPSDLYPKAFWRLPKGLIDKGEDIEKAALREVAEEGGVAAKITSKIGTSTYFLNLPQGRVMKFVTFYLMQWLSDLPEGTDEETSEVKWLEFGEARKLLSFSHEKQVLDKAASTLK